MRRASERERLAAVIEPTAVGEQTCTFLRRRHPRCTAENVAADLASWHVKTATIAKMLERQSTTGPRVMLALIAVYGPDFLRAILPTSPRWLEAASDFQECSELRRDLEVIQARLDALS